MYAVIKTGGKQYRVTPGDLITVEKLEGNIGDAVAITDVLMINSDKGAVIGNPLIKGASVTGTIAGQDRGKKILIQKFKRRGGYKKRLGHRQLLTQIKIDGIKG
jgi:large subunit ribosomal protein L21